MQLTDNVLGAVPRQRIQRKAAIKSRDQTRQLALQDEGDPDLMEQTRNHPRDLTPVPSREPSLDRSEDIVNSKILLLVSRIQQITPRSL